MNGMDTNKYFPRKDYTSINSSSYVLLCFKGEYIFFHRKLIDKLHVSFKWHGI